MNTIELIVLVAKKVKTVECGHCCIKTEIYENGKLKAVIPASSWQPRTDKKTIILNGWIYALKWE